MLAAIGLDPTGGHRRMGSACSASRSRVGGHGAPIGIYLWHLVVLKLISHQPEARMLPGAIIAVAAVAGGALALGAASWYLVERPVQRAFASRNDRRDPRNHAGRVSEIGSDVHSTIDPLNPAGVAVDHLA